jgi:HSP20 family protein
MSILKWRNLSNLTGIKDEIDRMFDSMFDKASFHSAEERYALTSSGTWAPDSRVFQRGNDTVIQINLPEFEKGDIKVSVSGNTLAIGSEINREQEFRGDNSYRYRRSHGSFCKVMELPGNADADNIKSSFKNGILEVVIPQAGSNTRSNVRSISIDTSMDTMPKLPPGKSNDGYNEEL